MVCMLNGVHAAKRELQLYQSPMISIITWMETLVGVPELQQRDVRGFLNDFEVVAIDAAIANGAITARKQMRLKLPDAIIWATALHYNVPLVTRNTKDFDAKHPLVRIPYRL